MTGTATPNKSELCFSTPSPTARKLYYYPLRTGHFFCEKIYRTVRKEYQGLFGCISAAQTRLIYLRKSRERTEI